MIFAFLACGGASLETRVEELRVMAIQPNPAEFSPFEDASISLLIPNPTQEPAKYLAWTCTNFGDGCLEKDYFESTDEYWGVVQDIQTDDPVHTLELDLPPVLTGLLSELPDDSVFGASLFWVLACENGLCPQIDDWLVGNPDYEAMNAPFELMEDLPKEGTSLAFRPLLISNRSAEARIQHPSLELEGEGNIELTGPNDSQDLSFNYALNQQDQSSDALYYAYATQGGFGMNDRYNTLLQEQSGSFSTEWFGTEDLESGSAQLMVILENGEGGISFWTSEGLIQ